MQSHHSTLLQEVSKVRSIWIYATLDVIKTSHSIFHVLSGDIDVIVKLNTAGFALLYDASVEMHVNLCSELVKHLLLVVLYSLHAGYRLIMENMTEDRELWSTIAVSSMMKLEAQKNIW